MQIDKKWIPCLLAAGLGLFASVAGAQVEVSESTFGGMEARAIGTAVTGGRIAAIDAVADSPLTMYIGTSGGGIWKSIDGGLTFSSVFDEHVQSIGALAIDPKNPRTVWAGTGESWTRNSVSIGDGVYKTTNGGDKWEKVGLGDSERIARIAIHPTDGNTVWVCATGHLWDGNDERGVYKTTDGGKTWKRTLFVDKDTGCSDLSVDPQDPSILYAGMWQFRRYPWAFRSGGAGSGLFKSTDGGETWRQLKQGLPSGDKGRIAIAVAPSRSAVVYALVEAKETALYRSDDTGESWRKVNSSFNVQIRPFYFARLVVDPTDFNYVYKPGLTLTISTDGGKTFSSPFAGGGSNFGIVHSDLHALWINPKDPQEQLLGTDGGVYTSADRGHHWRHVKALPVSQFYHVSYDMDVPYHVFGGLQDNGSWMGPSRGIGAVWNRDWRNIGGGDGFWAFRDAQETDFVYSEAQGGNAQRRRLSTGEAKEIKPLPLAGEPELRFNWNAPLVPSPNTPGTIYIGAQYLFRSRDRGDSWERISPDLTTNDPKKQGQMASGGLTIDNSSAENHTTIFSIAESPKNPQLIWVGTDDGNLQVTRDGGKTWTNTSGSIPGLPKGTWVSTVEPGRYDEATAFATFDGHSTGDMKSYVYKTTDYGKTWTPLGTSGLAGYAHVVRQDLVNPDLLFVGTELGLYLSIDGGAHWARFTGNFPKVSVRDVAIHPRESDLLIATHGRGVYILDDITPLRHLTEKVLDSEVALLPSRPAEEVIPADEQVFASQDEFAGFNPEESAKITYYLKKRHLFGDLKAEVYDAQGKLLTTIPGTKRKGLNRIDWPMRLPPPKIAGANSIIESQGAFIGPRVLPGTYTVKLIKGNETLTGKVELIPDPRSTHSAEDRVVQQQAAMKLYGMLERQTYLAEASLGGQESAAKVVAGVAALSAKDKLRTAVGTTATALEKFHKRMVATSEGGWLGGEVQLREKLGALYGGINGYEGRPSKSQLDSMMVLSGELEKAEKDFAAIVQEVGALNKTLAGRKLPTVAVPSLEEWKKKDAGQGAQSASGFASLLPIFAR